MVRHQMMKTLGYIGMTFFSVGALESVKAEAPKTFKTVKIAVINLEKIFPMDAKNGSDEWRYWVAKVNEGIEQDSKKIAEFEPEIKKKMEEYNKLKGLASEETLAKLVQEINQKSEYLQSWPQQKERVRAQRLQEVQQYALMPRIMKVAEDLRKKYSLDLVMPSNMAFSYDSSLELTSEVLVQINKTYADELKAKKAQQEKDKKGPKTDTVSSNKVAAA